jgi:hypothetical protein
MKITHFLVIGLIGFIVYRLTQTVQDAPPNAEPRARVEYLQTNDTPGRNSGGDGETRKAATSPLIAILQRLAAATPPPAPAGAPRLPVVSEAAPGQPSQPDQFSQPGQPFQPSRPGQPAAAAVVPPVPLSPRERLRLSEARRPALEDQYGPPQYFRGILRRHLPDGTILIGSSEVGLCIVEDYREGERMADGSIVGFDAWRTGSRVYQEPDGPERTALYLVHSGPPLPLWDQYGRPINRDVLAPETIRKAGVHTETPLDKKKK